VPLSKAASELLQIKDLPAILISEANNKLKGEQVAAILAHLGLEAPKVESNVEGSGT